MPVNRAMATYLARVQFGMKRYLAGKGCELPYPESKRECYLCRSCPVILLFTGRFLVKPLGEGSKQEEFWRTFLDKRRPTGKQF